MLLAYELSCLILALLAVLLTTTSWGRAIQRILGITSTNSISTLDAWIGIALLASFAECVQLIAPLQWPISLFCFVLAMMNILTWQRIAYIELCHRVFGILQSHRFGIMFFIIVFIFLCLGSMVPMGNYDSGLYHFGTIAWLNEYPIAIGLGNLHSRFAFNQSYFELIALLNFFPLWNKGYAMIGPVLITLTALTLVELRNTRPALPATVFIGCLILCGFLTHDLASPIPDLGIQTIQITIFALAFVVFKQYRVHHKVDPTYQCALLLLCALLVFVKLSGLAFALGFILITAPFFIANWNDPRSKQTMIRIVLLLLLFSGIHAIRGYLLSGAPLYPASIAAAWSLPWSMSPFAIQKELEWAYSWARIPGASPDQVLGNWQWYLPWIPGNWVTPWVKALPLSGKLAFTIALTAFVMQLFIDRKHRFAHKPYGMRALLTPLLLASLFWFFTAPDLRFLGSVHWLLAILCIYLLIDSLKFFETKSQGWQFIGVRAGVILAGCIAIAIQIQKPNLYMGWSQQPITPFKIEKTHSGSAIYIPIQGDQCNDAPLPCTPYFNPYLTYALYQKWWPLFIDTGKSAAK